MITPSYGIAKKNYVKFAHEYFFAYDRIPIYLLLKQDFII